MGGEFDPLDACFESEGNEEQPNGGVPKRSLSSFFKQGIETEPVFVGLENGSVDFDKREGQHVQDNARLIFPPKPACEEGKH